MVLTKNEYEELKKLAYETEEGYILRNPSNPNTKIKIFSNLPWEPAYLKIKIHTISLLLKNYDLLKETKISIPKSKTIIDTDLRGYESTFIEGISLKKQLFNPNIPLDKRINRLKQVGSILRDMKTIRQTSSLTSFYYNDIHEDNFIVSNEGIVYGTDIDGCKIEDNIPSMALYPSELSMQIKDSSKYQKCTKICSYTTSIIPSENLDLYCYIRMIINFMYGREIDDLNKDNFLEYLDFLEYYGGNKELLDTLSRIYDDQIDNINPDYLLNYIKEIYPYSNIHHDKSGNLTKVLR